MKLDTSIYIGCLLFTLALASPVLAACPTEQDSYDGIVFEHEYSNGNIMAHFHRRISETKVWRSYALRTPANPLHIHEDPSHLILHRGLLPTNSIKSSGVYPRTVRYKTPIEGMFPISKELDIRLPISIKNSKINPHNYRNKSHISVAGFEDFKIGECSYPVIRIRLIDEGPLRDGSTRIEKHEYLYSPELSAILQHRGYLSNKPYINIRKRRIGDKFFMSLIQNKKNILFDTIFDLDVKISISDFLRNDGE